MTDKAKQDEGMTLEEAKAIVGDFFKSPLPYMYSPNSEVYAKAVGFLQGWDARGVEDADIINRHSYDSVFDLKMEILKLQSEGEK